jgi:hypothetical protein
MVCTGCKVKHPASHVDGLRRTVDRFLPDTTPPEAVKQCGNCSAECFARVECNSCEIIACMSCWFELHTAFVGHEHKALTMYQVPGYNGGLWQYEKECTSCMLGASMGHCGTCLEGQLSRFFCKISEHSCVDLVHSGIMEGEKWYECNSCSKQWKCLYPVCESCLPAVKVGHPSDHEFLSYICREIQGQKEDQFFIKCITCGLGKCYSSIEQ